METLEEIAKAARVSRSTVSRVINNEPRVSQETRRRVWQVIRKYDFHPNTAARALAGKRSHIIGLAIQNPYNVFSSDAFFGMFVQAIALECEARDYYFMLSLVSTHKPETYSKIVRGGHLDGLIVFYSTTDTSFTDRLQSEGIPFVLVGRPTAGGDVYSVDVDNFHGAEQVAHHLARLGYEHIATITGPTHSVSSIDRLNGFLAGLQSYGLTCPPDYIQAGDYSEQCGYLAMQHLLSLTPRPQAVFAANDASALGAMRAVWGQRLRVPEDMAIVGYDDTPIAAMCEPPMTTVRQSATDMGRATVRLLLDQLSSDATRELTPQNVKLPVELVVRESCGAQYRALTAQMAQHTQAARTAAPASALSRDDPSSISPSRKQARRRS
jgi:LacI family transcriptional regulator